MPARSLFFALVVLSIGGSLVADPAPVPEAVPITLQPGDAELSRLIEGHVRFLADDLLEGRATGQRGHAIAALYAAAHFRRLGLEPAGEQGTYYQKVPLLEVKTNVEAGTVTFAPSSADPLALTAPNDVLVSAAPGLDKAEFEAESVFAGYGVSAPDFGHDDLKGLDLKGKIVVVLSGAPPWLPSEPRAHFTSSKMEQLAKTGAIGMLTLTTPRDESRRPWAFSINASRFPSMRLVEPSGEIYMGFPAIQARATANVAAARSLFKAMGRNFEEAVKAAEAKADVRFAIEGRFKLTALATSAPAESLNVLARLPGSDPALAGEPLVITSHLDHIGIGPAVDGDNLYNGMLDNAMGTSTVMTIAQKMAEASFHGRRPILFALVTGEEKGLLGSTWLSRFPSPGVVRFAANINIDMPVFTEPGREVVGWGAEHSSLGQTLVQSAGRQGFVVRPDPMPDETIFVRSDQYPFVRQGVPAIYVGPLRSVSSASFMKTRYHKPQDDFSQPFDWPSIGAYARFLKDVMESVASAEQAPAWVDGDFFQKTFAPSPK